MKAHRPVFSSVTPGNVSRKVASHRSNRMATTQRAAQGAASSGNAGEVVSSSRSGSAAGGQAVGLRQGGPAGFRLAVVGQLDSKNRLSLPKPVRDAIHVGPGDSVFLNVDNEHGDVPTVRVVKAVNPLGMMLDALAEDALRQFHAGETISFDELMDELEIDPASMSDLDVN
jgi:bifunctional DNA-binding transcriptional regulator/antitoxin component of YhaV-PrlF toxin-antitoxin module